MKIRYIPIHFNCLTFSLRTYLRLRKNGLIPEISFSNWHFRVYVFFEHHFESFEYVPIKPSKLSPFIFSLIHFFIPFRGYVLKKNYFYQEINYYG